MARQYWNGYRQYRSVQLGLRWVATGTAVKECWGTLRRVKERSVTAVVESCGEVRYGSLSTGRFWQ